MRGVCCEAEAEAKLEAKTSISEVGQVIPGLSCHKWGIRVRSGQHTTTTTTGTKHLAKVRGGLDLNYLATNRAILP